MNTIFSYVSLFCIFVGLVFHRSIEMTEAVLMLPISVLELSLKLVVNGCLWNGFLMLAKQSGLIDKLSTWLFPLFRWIYPELKEEKYVIGLLASNFIANFIGLGSLAMISGLQAMKTLDSLNEDEHISRSMKTLIIFNTTGCSILPMSIITMRSHYHSSNPMAFIWDTLWIGVITLTSGILIQKGVEHFGK